MSEQNVEKEEPLAKVWDVLDDVAIERVRQHERWGEQNHPDGTGPTRTTLNREDEARKRCEYAAEHGTVTYRHILEEEVCEAFAAADQARLREELVQVAAVAVAWVEKIDRDQARASHLPSTGPYPPSLAEVTGCGVPGCEQHAPSPLPREQA